VPYVWLILIGILAGIAGGLLGIGGSIVMIPAMTEILEPDQHLYQAAAMIVNLFVVLPAVYQHRRAGAIAWPTVGRFLPLAIVGVIAGVSLSEVGLFTGAGEAYLRCCFGAFLFLIALRDLNGLRRRGQSADKERPPSQIVSWREAATIALPTGLIGGFLGVGGGIIAVPLQRQLLRMPIRTAIANSAATIIGVSIVGASLKNYRLITEHGYTTESFKIAAVLIPTAIIGSLIGARMTHRLPVRTIKGAFCVLLLVASVRMVIGATRDFPENQTTTQQAVTDVRPLGADAAAAVGSLDLAPPSDSATMPPTEDRAGSAGEGSAPGP
jgi:uncharacterized membrane protein YfcA